MVEEVITVYTDGSCNTMTKTGGWASILLIGGKKIVIKGAEKNTTNQRMELTAVLKALEYVEANHGLTCPVHICADSQYVIDIEKRMPRLQQNNYVTKKGAPSRNGDLLRELIAYLQRMPLTFTKVISHQKKDQNENLNREADKLARSIVRENSKEWKD